MREPIDFANYAGRIVSGLRHGILLNTLGDRFNSMVIGWGHPGIVWNLPTFVAYVRDNRYTRELLEATGEFTISAPLQGRLSPTVMEVCGRQSGRDVDKAAAARLTLAEPSVIRVPGVMEAPLTLECRVLYAQRQVLEDLPKDVLDHHYSRPDNVGQAHTAYIGQVVDAYILR